MTFFLPRLIYSKLRVRCLDFASHECKHSNENVWNGFILNSQWSENFHTINSHSHFRRCESEYYTKGFSTGFRNSFSYLKWNWHEIWNSVNRLLNFDRRKEKWKQIYILDSKWYALTLHFFIWLVCLFNWMCWEMCS